MNYSSIIGIFWLIFIGYWIFAAAKAKQTVGRASNSLAAGYRLLTLLGVALFFILKQQRVGFFGSPNLLGLSGAVLCGLGIGIAIWARVYLGRNWGMPMTIRKDPELVTGGPYRYVRHPIYSGLILAVFGSALAGGLPWLILFAAMSGYFIVSLRAEEETMLQLFPGTYPQYKRRTKALIPFVV